MKFFVLNKRGGNKNLIKSFRKSAEDNGVEFIEVISENVNDIEVKDNDLVYRVTYDHDSVILEKKIMLSGRKIKTFYKKNNFDLVSRARDNVIDATLIHKKNNISIPKTKFTNKIDNQNIDNIIEKLGSFPIIIKETGGQRGEGLHKVENKNDLISLTSDLRKNEKTFIIREFIDSPGLSYRAIVLGNNVEFCYRNESIDKSDFRSNVIQKDRKRKEIRLNNYDREMCVNAVKVLGLRTGAVDFAYDRKDGKLKIFEVNMPYNFYPVEKDFNVSISKKILNYLMKNE